MDASIAKAKFAIINNLHLVFEEANDAKRINAIQQIWSRSSEATFVDSERIWRGHEDIDKCVRDLQKKFAGWAFREIGQYRPNMPRCE